MRNQVKSLTTAAWRAGASSTEQVTKAATRPVTETLSSLGGPIGSVVSGIGEQVNKVVQETLLVGEDVQARAVDVAFDMITFKPLRAGLASVDLLRKQIGEGSQAQPELDYLIAINDAGPYQQSLAAIVLATQYSNLNRSQEGVERFEGYLKNYADQITQPQKGLYTALLALLRAGVVQTVPIWQLWTVLPQISLVLNELKEAKALTDNAPDFTPNLEKIAVRWISGLLNAQLPSPFGNRDTAQEDLTWVERTINASIQRKAAAFNFLRETYFNLAVLARDKGDQAKAEEYLKLSTFDSFKRSSIILATPYSADPTGLREGIKRVDEPAIEKHPGKVFTVSGFDMSDFNFVITADETELLAIDSGTRPATAQAAHQFLADYYQQNYGKPLPKLTMFFATHGHWDHVGGHQAYIDLNSDLELYSRFHYATVRTRATNQTPPFQWYLSTDYRTENVSAYQPTVVVGQDPVGTEVELVVNGLKHRIFETTRGGTRLHLILPFGGGGETEDGMMTYFPDYRVLHVGDFMVPWIGTPYLIEGDFEALLGSIDLMAALDPVPEHLLHGHEPLTQFFGNVPVAVKFRPHLQWLYQETLKAIFSRKNLPEIQELNLFNKEILDPSQGDVQLTYLIFREVVINRIYHQHIGYWGPQLQGVDYLSGTEIGAAFSRYFDLSDATIAVGIQQMLDNGDHELAGKVVDWALTRYPNSQKLQDVRRQAFLKLKEKWQNINPFKFVMYSEVIDDPTKQIQ